MVAADGSDVAGMARIEAIAHEDQEEHLCPGDSKEYLLAVMRS